MTNNNASRGDSVRTTDENSVASQNQRDASTRFSQEASELFETGRRTETASDAGRRTDTTESGAGTNNDATRTQTDAAAGKPVVKPEGVPGSPSDTGNGTQTQGGDGFLEITPLWTKGIAMHVEGLNPAAKDNPAKAESGAPQTPAEAPAPKPEAQPGQEPVNRKEVTLPNGTKLPNIVKPGPVVQIVTRFGGTNAPPAEGTGVLVGPDGQKKEPIDGQRLIATAHHVVGEGGDPEDRKIYQTNEQNFRTGDRDGNGVLSKEELTAQIQNMNNAVANPHPEQLPEHGATDKERLFQLNHVQQNFDQISKISQDMAPGQKIDGITEKGLEEYYRRNLDISINTHKGEFKGERVATDQQGDGSVVRMKLDPKVEQALGDNMPITRTLPKVGEKISTEGYRGVTALPRFSDGTHVRSLITNEGKFAQHGTPQDRKDIIDVPANGGMSGGPATNKRGEIVGINSAIMTATDGNNYLQTVPAKEILDLLRKAKVFKS